MSSFSGSRLALARKRSGLTKKALAEKTGLSTRIISAYESPNEDNAPSDKTLKILAYVLSFPERFFYGDEIVGISADAVNFRARTKMTQKQRDHAIAASDLAMMFSTWIDDRFELPKVDIPVYEDVDPQIAAQQVRHCWGLGQKPIRNVVVLLESHGVRVFSLYEESRRIDAFSFWDTNENRPFVFLSTAKSGERGRMDAAHELGHLVMHRYIDVSCPEVRDLEKEANEFASSFLMPEVDVLAYAPQSGMLKDFIAAKTRWRVSVSALIYRMHHLGLLSRWQYQSLYKQISYLGMRAEEPNAIQREQSQILDKVFEYIDSSGSSLLEILSELSIPYEELAKLSFKPPIRAIPGGGRLVTRPATPDITVVRGSKMDRA